MKMPLGDRRGRMGALPCAARRQVVALNGVDGAGARVRRAGPARAAQFIVTNFGEQASPSSRCRRGRASDAALTPERVCGHRPDRGGREPGRTVSLRRQPGRHVGQYDIGADGALLPKSPAVAAGDNPERWR